MFPRFLAVALLAAAALAQAPTNQFEIYSGCVNYTSRGTLLGAGGEILMQMPATHFAGVATSANGSGTALLGMSWTGQDQDCSTQETYSLVVRAADTTGAPNCTAAGLLLRVGPFGTPRWPECTYMVTIQFATPSPALPECGTFFYGAEVAAAPRWTADGLSFHISTYYPVNGSQGDNPAAGAPNLAWDCTAAGAAQPAQPRTIRFGLLVENATLALGNVDPTVTAANCVSTLGRRSFGVGGLWPACQGSSGPRNDGLDVRVRSAAHPGGMFAMFLGPELGCPGVAIPGVVRGALYLTPNVLVTSGSLGITGEGTATILPPGSTACLAVRGSLVSFQAGTLGPSLTLPVHLTHRAGTSFLP